MCFYPPQFPGGTGAIDWILNYKYFLDGFRTLTLMPLFFPRVMSWMLKNPFCPHCFYYYFFCHCSYQFIFSGFAFSRLFFSLPSLPIIFQVGDFGEQPSDHPRAAPNFPEHVSFVR